MTEIAENIALFLRLLEKSAQTETLKKAVFSKPSGKEILKAAVMLKTISGENVLQIEYFYSDNKAKHKNIKIGEGLLYKGE